jgi:hypothetical protein
MEICYSDIHPERCYQYIAWGVMYLCGSIEDDDDEDVTVT